MPADPSTPTRDRLEAAGVRPTAQRLSLAELLFAGGDRHLTAEDVWAEAREAGVGVSLATVYNTLNHFVEVGLVRAVELPGVRGVFDTNPTPHHHLLDERTGRLHDLAAEAVALHVDPAAIPSGATLSGVDIVVRIR